MMDRNHDELHLWKIEIGNFSLRSIQNDNILIHLRHLNSIEQNKKYYLFTEEVEYSFHREIE